MRTSALKRAALGGGAAALALGVAGLSTASAATTHDATASKSNYYAGKTIYLEVGSSAGGGQDSQARVLATYWGNYIPGHPTIVVEDIPANSGTVAMVNVSQVEPAKGLYVDMADGSLPLKELFKVPGATYHEEKMIQLGSWVGSGPVVMRTGKAANFAAVRQLTSSSPVIEAAVSPGSQSAMFEDLGMAFLKVPFRMVFGYSSNGPIALAFKAGTADAAAVSMSGFIKSFQPNNDSYGLFQFGLLSKDGKNVVPDPYDVINGVEVPTIEQLWQQENNTKKTPTGGVWSAIKQVASLDNLTDTLNVRKGTPASVVSILESSFQKMLKDPTFQAQAKLLNGEPMRGLTPTQTHDALVQFFKTPKGVESLMYGGSGYAS